MILKNISLRTSFPLIVVKYNYINLENHLYDKLILYCRTEVNLSVSMWLTKSYKILNIYDTFQIISQTLININGQILYPHNKRV